MENYAIVSYSCRKEKNEWIFVKRCWSKFITMDKNHGFYLNPETKRDALEKFQLTTIKWRLGNQIEIQSDNDCFLRQQRDSMSHGQEEDQI